MSKTTHYYALQKPKSKMTLLALFLFMIGAVDLYGRIRTTHREETPSSLGMSPLVKLAALGAIAAAALELGHLSHFVG
jgi:hypothetical protein